MHDLSSDFDTAPATEMSEWEIPDLPLHFQGETGSVSFRSLEELTSDHLQSLRTKISIQGEGSATHAMYDEAMRILITNWDVPKQPTLPIPRGDKNALKRLSAVVRRDIEKHLHPFLYRLLNDRDTGNP